MTKQSSEPEHEHEHQPGAGLLDALVEGERASMRPPRGAQDETWERVVGTVGLGGPPPIEPTSIGPAAMATTAWVKILLGVVLGVAVVAGYRITTAPPEPDPASSARAPARVEPAAEPVASPAQQAQPPAAAAPPDPSPAPPPTPAVVQPPEDPSPRRARAEPAESAPAPAPTPASNLAEETRLLAAARARLRVSSPSGALVPLGEHARRFPQGQLTEDRMVLRAQALCEAGDRAAGRQQAASLRKAFPESSHLPRVDRACR